MQTILFPVSAAAFPLHHGVRELLENALDQALSDCKYVRRNSICHAEDTSNLASLLCRNVG